MILEPNVVVLYVDNLAITSQFYQDLLGIKAIEASSTFHSLMLSNGMSLALKARHSVMPATQTKNGHGELAFTVDSPEEVDKLFSVWQAKKIEILLPPTQEPFGYTFVAVDPDGYRLRVASLSPMVKQVEGFIVTGFSARTQNKDEFNEKTAKLPNLWQQFYSSDLAANPNAFGVYSNYDSDANDFYTVTVGVESSQIQGKLNSVTIQAGHYLVFQGTGPIPAIVVETWQRVWTFFEINTEYRRNFISDFEVYKGHDQVIIYIGLDLYPNKCT